jgi:lysine/ornithine N-monooxygenase
VLPRSPRNCTSAKARSRTRVFDPDAVGGFYSADPGVRRQLINYHRSTNYSAFDLPLIEDLYAREYAERVAGTGRCPRAAPRVCSKPSRTGTACAWTSSIIQQAQSIDANRLSSVGNGSR